MPAAPPGPPGAVCYALSVVTPVEPKPAASVVLARPGAADPVEVYMIRRQAGMRFLGGFYAFPGGKVDAADAAPASLGRCRGLSREAAASLIPTREGIPSLAFWVAAIRELLEETGVLMACDDRGRAVDLSDPGVARQAERCRKALMAGEGELTTLFECLGWFYDVAPLRYLAHFITPASSPIRFTARFFLAPVPAGQEPRLFLEETSEGFWLGAREGRRRFRRGELAMAEPAEYTLGYLAQFDDAEALWRAHADGGHKFHGLVDRIDFYGEGHERERATRTGGTPPWQP